MRSIDVHTHLLPAEIPRWSERFGYGGFIRLERKDACTARMVRDDGTFFRDVTSNVWDPAVRIAESNEAEVGVQVLSTVPVMFGYWISQPRQALDVARFLNDQLADACARDRRKLLGLCTLPLQAPDLAVEELTRCVRDLGLAGVQIGSHVGRWNLDAPELFPVFARAAELGCPVFVHPWDMMGQERMQKYWLPWLVGMPAEGAQAISSVIFGGVLERLPELRLCFAHGGGAFAFTFGRIQHGFESRPDLCGVDNPRPPRDYLGKFWVDSLVHDELALRLVLRRFGDDKVVVGSDYPFPLGEDRPGALIRSLADLPQAKLLVSNALAWLGRSSEGLDLDASA
ncbi:MAG: amidohydrolase [Deltaproteobacteria bacterium]|nr:MAG: amidohydrolase [Deltaproteobacteria bacterium]